MNYAWANPSDGTREQTTKATPERMLAAAKRRVWQELQELSVTPPQAGAEDPGCLIWRQASIGNVSLDGPAVDRPALDQLPDASDQFAWCDPETGQRIVSESFPGQEMVDQLKKLQERRDSKNEVIVYATWPEYLVHRSDPEPPELPAESLAGDSPDIDAQKQILEEVVVLDDATKLAKVTAWALLDIAMVLRESVGYLRYPEPIVRRNPYRRARRRRDRLGLWERFKLWVWGSPKEDSVTPPQAGAEDWAGMPEEFASGGAQHDHSWSNALWQNCEGCEARRQYGGPSVGWIEYPAQVRSGGTPTDKEETPKTHVFTFSGDGHSYLCRVCHRPEKNAIHGYTGD
jgi:hypothetical protein